MKNNSSIVPVVSYVNADTHKVQILSENNKKSGIYLWTNLINKKQYVGSSIDLRKRFYPYYNVKYLELNKSMTINRALLKYGYSNFSLDILEYCDPKDLLGREKYYINLLEPKYNISKEPSSFFLGLNHSEETKVKISAANIGSFGRNLGNKHSQEARAKMRAASIGKNKGKNHSKETKAKLRVAAFNQPSCMKIEVTDLELDTKTIYPSISEAARALSISQSSISQYFAKNQQKPCKRRYIFKKIS